MQRCECEKQYRHGLIDAAGTILVGAAVAVMYAERDSITTLWITLVTLAGLIWAVYLVLLIGSALRRNLQR